MPVAYEQTPTADAVDALLRALISIRKPRPVVTPMGKRARGYVPSYKQVLPKFESLVEEDVLRVLEVASTVVGYITHPFVLDLSGDAHPHCYTPDAKVTTTTTIALLEAKGDHWLSVPSSRRALIKHVRALKALQIPFILLLERDVRSNGLHERLKLLLRERPVCSRKVSGLDPNCWDPAGTRQPSGGQLRRWREAQKECDALLDRVMRRDPDEVLEQAAV